MKILITGGAGFIGSAVIRKIISETTWHVCNVDKLTYAASLASLSEVETSGRYQFEKVDICDESAISALFSLYQPDAVMHLAAETHVDRSINGPADFINTNIVGTYQLLDASYKYWCKDKKQDPSKFIFHHISTDEVFGELGEFGKFNENTPYDPNSPYSASKASSDHLVRAWHKTYGLPTIVTNCSNNYGPYQFPEKLIPHMLFQALEQNPLPVYGDGSNIRDWIYVDDHADGLIAAIEQGQSGDTYLFGGNQEISNLDLVKTICSLLDEEIPRANQLSYADLINFVADRPGHDFRYAIDTAATEAKIDWKPKVNLEQGLRQTIQWYLSNKGWRQSLAEGYKGSRLGLLGGEELK